MDLDEIKQYAHKVKQIKINNTNKHSLYSYVVVKINMPSQDDEVVRFSVSPNDNFINHQHSSVKNDEDTEIIEELNDDYYCYIPNKLNSVTTLYAHFFPSSLYSYDEELNNLVSIYTLKELFENAEIKEETKYKHNFTEEGKLIVQSTDSTSIDGTNNPNYKHYTYTQNNNSTEIGQFPLSSRYRSHQNWKVPQIESNAPYWEQTDEAADPAWEARIKFEGLEAPVNVFLNYEYLPTSREYHQHYFGFEPSDMNASDNACKTINVFEGTNINQINSRFGSKNNYRLINLGNKYDDSRSIYVPHDNDIPIDLDDFKKGILSVNDAPSCSFSKNKCKDYWIYTPLNTTSDENYCEKKIDLNAGHYYSLKYYIYVPLTTNINANDGYVSVFTTTDEETIEYKIDNSFIRKDKSLRNQWVYHEVPFIAQDTNIIRITGPQTKKTSEKSNSIFFIHMSLHEMTEYSPTIKYTSTGVHIVEEGQKAFKPLSEEKCPQGVTESFNDVQWKKSELEFPTPFSDVNIISQDEDYIYYDKYTTNFFYQHPTFTNDSISVINFDEQKNLWKPRIQSLVPNVEYDENTGDVSVTYRSTLKGVYGPNNKFTFKFVDSNGDYVTEGTVEIGIFMQKDSESPNGDAAIPITYDPIKVNGIVTVDNIDLTFLANNSNFPDTPNKYFIRLKYVNPCTDTEDINKTEFKTLYVEKESAKIYQVEVNDIPSVIDHNIVSDVFLDSNKDLIISYVSVDNLNTQTTLLDDMDIDSNGDLVKEHITYATEADVDKAISSIYMENGLLCLSSVNYKLVDYHITSIDDFPIKIEALVTDQFGVPKNKGYCELSINDSLHQSTLIDEYDEYQGWADFYLGRDDIKHHRQTIKIEFYRKPFASLSFVYFDLIVDDFEDLKNYVPISVKHIGVSGITTPILDGQTYYMPDETVCQDCLQTSVGNYQRCPKCNSTNVKIDYNCALLTITHGRYKQFRVEVWRDDEMLIRKNVYNDIEQLIDLYHATLAEWKQHDSYTYRIVTGNMFDEKGHPIEEIWQDHEHTFTISKRSS